MGNDVYIWELASVFGEMTSLFDKRLRNVENDLGIWKIPKIFGKWLRFIGHGLSI